MHDLKDLALVSALLACLASAGPCARAQEHGSCSLPLPPDSASYSSIFNLQKEQWLGDVEADAVEPGLTLQPESASKYLTQIGNRLVAALPATSTRYSFHIFESDGVAAFALAGGHIYVSRKLVLDAQSEDELAAVLAQEIGRAYIHHSASLVTLRLEKLLHVRSVKGRSDIEDKVERLLNTPLTEASDPKPGDRDKDELLADRVAFYALIKAGYVPEALTTLLDRTGGYNDFDESAFAPYFDFESDADVRAGQAHEILGDLPLACRDSRPQYRPGFKVFKDALRNSRIDPTVPASPGLKSIALTPPMNPALLNVRLSRNGKYALAQDESQNHVLSTDPLKLLFSIDARGAGMAQFTPDSKSVTFSWPALRVEDWDVASKQRAGLLDWVDYERCGQSSLSPNGMVFACLTSEGERRGLKVTDLSDGQIIFQDAHFPNPDSDSLTRLDSILRWSQDGRYLLYAGGPLLHALDVKTGKQVPIQTLPGFSASNQIQFVDSDRLLYGCRFDYIAPGPQSTMCLASFPQLELHGQFNLDGRLWLAAVTRGPHVLAGPFDGASARLLDPAAGNLGQKFDLETVDLSGDTVAQEIQEGGLSVGQLGGPTQTSPLPVTPIQSFEAAAFSADGRYLALSDRARGAIWDLTTGNRLKITHPFRAAAFDDRGRLEAIQVNQELKPAGDGTIDRETDKAALNFTVGATAVQFGDVIVEVVPRASGDIVEDVDLNGLDAATKSVLWAKHFSQGLPRLIPVDGDRVLLMMPWTSSDREEEVRGHKQVLIRTSDAVKKDDKAGMLVEVVSRRTGATERLMLVPSSDSYPVNPAYASLFGNLLAVEGTHNNATIYRETDGERLFGLFGAVLAGDGGLGLIAARNRPQELTLYNVAGDQLGHWTLDSPILAARIIPEKKQLLALTATQRVYAFDLQPSAPAAQP